MSQKRKSESEHRETSIRRAFVVLSLIAFTASGFATYLGVKLGRSVEPYAHLNPARNIYKEKDLIVDFQRLREELEAIGKGRTLSIYFEYLPTGANINVNKDLTIWPASLIKVPIAMAAMKKVEKGDWGLSNELVILDTDKDKEFGTLYQKPTGTTITIENLLKESLVNSDNTAHFVLLRNLENDEIENLYRHLGLGDIIDDMKRAPWERSSDNRITAKRYSIFFRSLYNATFLEPAYAEQFIDILAKNKDDQYLGSVIPEDIAFAHKTGIREDDQVYADSGIVYVPHRPYILTVMVQLKGDAKSEDHARTIMADISKRVYEYVSTYDQTD